MLLRLLALMLVCFPLLVQAEEPLFLYLDKKQEDVLIVKVIDADKIVLENGHRIQLIGVESIGLPPKKYAQRDKDGLVIEESTDGAITIEEQALTFAQELMENKKVRIEYDAEHRSPEGYLYAYVFLPDGQMANAVLLKMGFVYLSISPPNIKYAKQLRVAYQEAREQKRGLLGE